MYVYGASGHGKVIVDILEAMGYIPKAFIDDDTTKSSLLGLPVIHAADGCSPMVVAVGDNKIRKRIVSRLDCEYVIAVHPSSVVSPRATIGEGSVIMQGAIIQTGVTLGRHTIINTGASVDHDCQIADFVHVSPHATLCGAVSVGEATWVGAGAVIRQCVNIGKNCVIGAGTVVVKDVPDGAVVVGNPAHIL